jgi:general secretion pathway protein G
LILARICLGKFFMRRKHRKSIAIAGMTLLELILATTILMVLASAALPIARVSIVRTRENELHRDLREMRDAIDRYKDDADKGLIRVEQGTEGYPPDLDTLVKGVPVAANQVGATGGGAGATPVTNSFFSGTTSAAGQQQSQMNVRFLRKIPVDPMTGQAQWGLRSVQDDPSTTSWGGKNVFDVYSLSQGTALNGQKYSDW